jgi:RNA polymerase sigma-70 factor, ECF subfamily
MEHSGETDEMVMASIAKGDADALTELTRRYWEAIRRFCASYMEDDALAEDVAQETFAKLSGAEEYPTGMVKPWLYKVARNRCLDILRRHQRSPTHNRPIKTGFDAARDTSGPQTRAIREERAELIRQIIAAMPEEYKSVLVLKHYESLSREEMAEALGVTDAAVKGRLVRASEHLRQELQKHTKF